MVTGKRTTARSCCLFVFQGLAWSLEARLGTPKVWMGYFKREKPVVPI